MNADETLMLGWWTVHPAEALTTSLTPEHFGSAQARGLCVALQRRGWTIADLTATLGPTWTETLDRLDKAARFADPAKITAASDRLRENFAAKAAEAHAAAFLKSIRTRTTPILEAIQELVRGLAEAEAMTPVVSRSYGVVATEVMTDWAESISNPELHATLPLPLPSLQEHTGGWAVGKLHLIGGRSSEHKTTFARQAAQHLASLGHRVAYHTAEDSDRDIAIRTLAHDNRLLDTRSLMLGKGPYERDGITGDHLAEVLQQAQQSIESDAGKHLRIIDVPNPKLSQLLGSIKAEAAKGTKAYFFDFLQLCRPDRGIATNDWWRDCVAALAGLAKQLRIVLVCTSQIEKTGTQASVEQNRIPRADEMPNGAVLRQGAFACLMVGIDVHKDTGAIRFGVEIDKWKSAKNMRAGDDARKLFNIEPGHDRITERRKQ